MLRVHANLGYLCGSSDHALKPGAQRPHPPYYVRPPPSMPQLADRYSRLRELFPGWIGKDGQAAERMGGAGSAAQSSVAVQ